MAESLRPSRPSDRERSQPSGTAVERSRRRPSHDSVRIPCVPSDRSARWRAVSGLREIHGSCVLRVCRWIRQHPGSMALDVETSLGRERPWRGTSADAGIDDDADRYRRAIEAHAPRGGGAQGTWVGRADRVGAVWQREAKAASSIAVGGGSELVANYGFDDRSPNRPRWTGCIGTLDRTRRSGQDRTEDSAIAMGRRGRLTCGQRRGGQHGKYPSALPRVPGRDAARCGHPDRLLRPRWAASITRVIDRGALEGDWRSTAPIDGSSADRPTSSWWEGRPALADWHAAV